MEYNEIYDVIKHHLLEKNKTEQRKISRDKFIRFNEFCKLLSAFAEQNNVTDISISVDDDDEITIILHGSYSFYFINRDENENNLAIDCFVFLVASTKSFTLIPSADASDLKLVLTVPSIFV